MRMKRDKNAPRATRPRRRSSLPAVLRAMRLSLLAFAALVCLACLGGWLLRRTLLQNARQTGLALARSYAEETHSNLTVYETLVNYGTANLNTRMEQGDDTEDLFAWAQLYFDRLTAVLGDGVVSPFLFKDGEILNTMDQTPMEVDPTYIATERDWYRLALDAQGAVVFTDLYTDVVTGEPVLSAVQMCADGSTVLGFDIFPRNFHYEGTSLDLDAGDSFFLCDGSGVLLYARTELDVSEQTLRDYCADLLKKVRAGELGEYDDFIRDKDGQKRAVYVYPMQNGWYTVVTTPYSSILRDIRLFIPVLGLILAVYLLVLAFTAWRESRYQQRIGRTNETVRVLGNSYYALYRVDYGANTYETIKGSDYVRARLAPVGPYDDLLRVAGEVIEPRAYDEFLRSFSTGNIRDLVRRRVRDFGGEFQRRFSDGYRWVSVRVLFDESLAPQEVVLCFREVEQEKQQQMRERQVLEDALAVARQNEISKQAFFSNMSHDMRTPLNAIVGLSELAEHCDDPAKVRERLGKINTASRQLLGLINDILDMSRMEQGKVVLNEQQFDLRRCVQDCLEPFRFQAEKENKTLTADLQIEDARLMGDPMRIGQILNNLLSNAFKFTGEGGHITLRVEQMDRGEYAKYKIVVQDDGIGMSAEFLPHLFEPYSREMRFSARQTAGTGLGMPITRNLVSQMNGEINVESEQGKGTVFTLVLPFAVAEDAPAPAPETTADRTQSLAGKRILLAEDNEVNMEITTELLGLNGVQVTQAWNGREALELFAASEPFAFDAILMDMQMPEMDGCEAARRIRALRRPDAARIPILAVTANAFAEDIAATTAAGMNAHVSKPIDFGILCRTLGELTGAAPDLQTP